MADIMKLPCAECGQRNGLHRAKDGLCPAPNADGVTANVVYWQKSPGTFFTAAPISVTVAPEPAMSAKHLTRIKELEKQLHDCKACAERNAYLEEQLRAANDSAAETGEGADE